MLVPSQTVTENILLGLDAPRFLLNLPNYDNKIAELGDRFGLKVDPRAKVWQLSVGEQQRVEILKMLYRGVDVLIMDEPTAVLAPQEIEGLFVTLRDPLAVNDRLGVSYGGPSTNGSFNFLSETANSPFQFTNLLETFTEPRKFDTVYRTALNVSGVDFNSFFPWQMDQDGGDEEFLNHAGRHELNTTMFQSFIGDTNLVTFTNVAQRAASGVLAANSNSIGSFFQIVEDPRTNGLYFGVNCSDISPFGGTHTAGQIVTLTGGTNANPTNMVITLITHSNTVSPTTLGLYRNPLPMSDGTLVAVWTDTANGIAGFDTNIGTATLPVSKYHFRLYTLTNGAGIFSANQLLNSGGIQATSIYWDGATLVTNGATQWELQPVEVRAKQIPQPTKSAVASIEQKVFAEEGVDLPTFQADLAQRNLALCISRNVTARDLADKQQPYNLRVPGGSNSIANSGQVYDITHLTFLQADYLRGYTNGPGGLPQPGRRILAVPMHTGTNFNYASSQTNAPPGGTEILSDGSQATFIPANRAVTWHLTGTTNESVVKERYWISFKPGEVRTCANCHGINAVDQLGRPAPTNAPLALQKLLQFWKTNSASAYTLIVSNGSGGGNFGAGSILALTANVAPSGKVFVGWSGAVSNATSVTTLFIMPTNSATVTALFTNLPPPVFSNFQFTLGASNLTLAASALPNQLWILQSSADLLTWQDMATNVSTGGGLVQFTNAIGNAPQKFYRLKSP